MPALPSWFLPIALLTICLSVGYATVSWLRAFASTLPARRLTQLELSQDDLRSQVEALLAQQKRLNARFNMREARDKPREAIDVSPAADPLERKAKLRRELGLFGANAARVAQSIHTTKGVSDG